MRNLLAGLMLWAWLAGAALAWEPDPVAVRTLERGRPYVQVRSDGAAGVIHAAIDVAAPAEAIWSVILDCDRASRMVASLKSCSITERGPDGAWDVREHVSKPSLFPSVRNVFRSDYDMAGRIIRFQRVDGDMKLFEGEWRLTALEGGRRTRIVYESRAVVPFRAPAVLVRMAARRDVAAALIALRREAMRQP